MKTYCTDDSVWNSALSTVTYFVLGTQNCMKKLSRDSWQYIPSRTFNSDADENHSNLVPQCDRKLVIICFFFVYGFKTICKKFKSWSCSLVVIYMSNSNSAKGSEEIYTSIKSWKKIFISCDAEYISMIYIATYSICQNHSLHPSLELYFFNV